jgi:prepilin-type processing-associated H-X9-DG protein
MDPTIPESEHKGPQPLDYATPSNKPSQQTSRFAIILVLIFLLFLLVSILLSSLDRSRMNALANRQGSNLRQIGQAILLYSVDDGGEYPDSFQTLLLNEDITSEVFVSPFRAETPAVGPSTQAIASQLTVGGGHMSYIYLGKGLSMSKTTFDTIVAYDLPATPGTGTNMLFGDGHVEYIDPPTTAKILARVSAGQFPVTRPSRP